MPQPSTSQQAPIRGSGTKCRKCGGVILHEWSHCADCDTHLDDDQDDAVEMDALGPQRKAVIRPVALKVKGATPSRGSAKAPTAAKPKLDPSIDLSSRYEPEPIKRSFPTGLVAAIAAGALVFVVGIGGAMMMSGGGEETAAAPAATATSTPVIAIAIATATPAATPTVVAVATPAPKAAVAAKGKKGKKVASAAKKKHPAHKQVASASSGLPF